MSNREYDLTIWADDTYPCAIPRGRRPLPLTTVRSQRSWHESLEARVRYEISNLVCEEWCNLEGVIVRRSDAHTRNTYHVNYDRTSPNVYRRYAYEDAVARVLEIAGGGE